MGRRGGDSAARRARRGGGGGVRGRAALGFGAAAQAGLPRLIKPAGPGVQVGHGPVRRFDFF